MHVLKIRTMYVHVNIYQMQKPNSSTNNFIEVCGHNLESSQTLGFCIGFLNHREGGMVFLLSPVQCEVA